MLYAGCRFTEPLAGVGTDPTPDLDLTPDLLGDFQELYPKLLNFCILLCKFTCYNVFTVSEVEVDPVNNKKYSP